MKLLPTLTLLLCLHIPLAHSFPALTDDQKNNTRHLAGITAITAALLCSESVFNGMDIQHYNHLIEENRINTEIIKQKDKAYVNATVNLIAGLSLGIYGFFLSTIVEDN